MWTILCLAVCITAVTAYPTYQQLIPNGRSVPSPCSAQNWAGVGHLLSGGTGPLNPFGMDFAAAGHTWTRDLCRKDSDNDGKTNGEELGDPHCHFTPEKPGHLQNPTGHPGICEPLTDAKCVAQGFQC